MPSVRKISFRYGFAILFILWFSPLVIGQSAQFHFNRLSIEDGLSQSLIKSIVQDDQGFMWFATADGLNQYNGYDFTVYRQNASPTQNLGDNDINTLMLSQAGNLWVGTQNAGLYVRDHETLAIMPFPKNDSLGNSSITALLQSRSGLIWIGTGGGGLFTYDPKSKDIKRLRNIKGSHLSLHELAINNLFEDSHGTIWIGTALHGLFNIQKDGTVRPVPDKLGLNPISVYCVNQDEQNHLLIGTNRGVFFVDLNTERWSSLDLGLQGGSNSHFIIQDILMDPLGMIWIGVSDYGLYRWNPTTANYQVFRNDPTNPGSPSLNSFSCLYKDSSGLIWVGTTGAGVNYFDPRPSFFSLKYSSNSPFGISNQSVRAIEEDLSDPNVLWIGGYSGLEKYNKLTGRIKTYSYEDLFRGKEALVNPFPFQVFSLLQLDSNRMLIGTEGSGVFLMDKSRESFEHLVLKGSGLSQSVLAVYDLFRASDGAIWGGTRDGLCSIDLDSMIVRRLVQDWGASDPPTIMSIVEDNLKNLWVGSSQGLYYFHPIRGELRPCTTEDASLSTGPLKSLYFQSPSTLWVGSSGQGLFCLNIDPKSKHPEQISGYRKLTEENGLANNVIYGIVPDEHAGLWLSTNRGLSHYKQNQDLFTNYQYSDGLQSQEFNSGAHLLAPDGTIYFGGINGLSYFHPQQIRQNIASLPLVVTSYRNLITGEHVRHSASKLDHIFLDYDENLFSIEFAALNYISSKRNHYAYKLEGISDQWVELGTQRTITFSDLDPGEYTLFLRGVNTLGHTTSTLGLKISITPPFWSTLWFRVLSGLAILSLFALIFLFRVRLERKKKKALEAVVSERTGELVTKTEELEIAKNEAIHANKAKTDFLATMSHEIRTPMSVVIGMTAMLQDTDLTEKQKEYSEVIKNSGEILLNIINDILDLSKIEAGKVELEKNEVNLGEVIEKVLDMMALRAFEKGLELAFHIDPTVPLFVRVDEIRLAQVLTNLVSNAIKFTSKGEVILNVSLTRQNISAEEEHQILFEVADTGVGIPPHQLSEIFEAFRQGDASTTRKFGGTGLGLTISHRLVELMEGQLWAESRLEQGSTFSFTHPLEPVNIPLPSYLRGSNISFKRKCAMVIEPNFKVRQILVRHLRFWGLDVLPAEDWEEGVKLANDNPNIHICLFAYPQSQSSAFKAFRSLKDMATERKIPVIAMTPFDRIDLAAREHQGELYKVLSKPIKPARLFNLLLTLLNRHAIRLIQNAISNSSTTDLEMGIKQPLKILIAENHEVYQALMVKMLERLGYRTDIVENGQEIIDLMKVNTYDLILMDLQMPVMDGLEATRQIRLLPINAKQQPMIVAVTANALPGDHKVCLQAGMDDYTSKPLLPEKLEEILRTCSERKLKKNSEVKDPISNS